MHERLDAALKRLANALDELEAAEARRHGPGEALAQIKDDREKHRSELEDVRRRAETLEAAQDEVLARLNRAQAAIQSILAKSAKSAKSQA